MVAVAERGSLRSASRHLKLAQSAITRSIRELEHEFGAALFERRATGVILTPVGEAFVRRAKAIQSDLQRAREEVEQMKGAAGGAVSVGLSTAAHIALLPRVLDPFRRRYPEVRLKVIEGLFPSLEADLRDGVLDFYVGPLAGVTHPVELQAEPLFDNRLIVVCREGHALGGATSLGDLIGAHWICSSIAFDTDAVFHPVFDAHRLARPKIAAQTETALSTLVLVASSDLLALIPQQWQEVLAATKILQKVPIREVLEAAPICAVRRVRLPLTPAAEHLCDLFKRAALPHARGPSGEALRRREPFQPQRVSDREETSDAFRRSQSA